MQQKVSWLKPAIWGAVLGSVFTMIVGFSWGGWTTGGTAETGSSSLTPLAPRETASVSAPAFTSAPFAGIIPRSSTAPG
jgi:hypothetical protein